MRNQGSERTNGLILLAAVFADSINLEGVAGGYVVVFLANLLFQLPDLLREKFYRTAAPGADHVVMTAPVVLVFVAGDAVVECHFTGKAAFG